MAGKRKTGWWAAWVIGSLLLAGGLGWMLVDGTDRTVFMPGEVSDGHHQIAMACEACHTEPFGGQTVLQEACIDCHGEERVKPVDSHPRAKFKDPRNAERLAKIDALHCVTCHSEHRPEITARDGLTQPRDVCYLCHADVAEERPSHAGMDFMTCKNSGCHNFHDNRSLYTNFLVKHLDEPAIRDTAQVPARQFGALLAELPDYPLQRYPVQQLTLAQADAPPDQAGSETLQRDWLETAHARAGVNCSGCHQPQAENEAGHWIERPDQRACASCHGLEVKAFGRGKHGMRLAVGLEPMTPALARLPMHAEAADTPLTCTTCHGAHRFNTVHAAAEACQECHADEHSQAWQDSPHARLWQQEQAGELPAGSGVSCATCHQPRMEQDVNDWMSRIVVEHNQSAVQSPNSKMIRPVCLQCHGLEFSLDALADRELIRRNFRGRPTTHIATMDLARQEKQRRDAKRGNSDEEDTSMFGF